MNIVLATGIYPPDIGGPATYVCALAEGLRQRGMDVTVVTYGDARGETRDMRNGKSEDAWKVVRVAKSGGPLMRWMRYARALREHAADADIVEAFSSISCGVPLWMARLRHPKKILRLGGDFFWERFTDRGGTLTLDRWYATRPWTQGPMNGLLRRFDHIVFSTAFQEGLYERIYKDLPLHSVIENALPSGMPVEHAKHAPLRLLFLGRFVPFKNLGSLLLALKELPSMTLTLAGEGPLEQALRALAAEQEIADRVSFLPPRSGDGKQQLLLDHDLLVLPSYTEISPNAALEARAAGLPVLLTEETGLSRQLTDGVLLRPLLAPRSVAQALLEAEGTYEILARRAAASLPPRTWDTCVEEHMALFRSLL